MNILHVVSTMDPKTGGVCQAIRTIISGLSGIGVANGVVCLDDPTAYFLKKEDLKIHAVGPGKSPWHYSPRLFIWLKQHIADYDIVIVHGLWQYHSYATLKSWKLINRKKPKLFVMPHGMLDPYFQRAQGRKLKALRNWIYWKFIEGSIINHADGVLFTCVEELHSARLPFAPYTPKREIVVGLGIEAPPVFTPEMHNEFLKKCPDLNGQSYILYLSRVHKKKGIDLLIKAYSSLLEENLHSKSIGLNKDRSIENSTLYNKQNIRLPKLVIAGPGVETSYGRKILKIASHTPELKSAIFFTGMIMGNQKWGAVYGCEVFILPSHQENFGIAIIEAQACGKPVLISNKVNIWKEIEQSGGGLVAADTLEGAKQLLKGWIEMDQQKRSFMENKAKKNFADSFEILPVAVQFLDKITEVSIN